MRWCFVCSCVVVGFVSERIGNRLSRLFFGAVEGGGSFHDALHNLIVDFDEHLDLLLGRRVVRLEDDIGLVSKEFDFQQGLGASVSDVEGDFERCVHVW